MSMVQKKGFVLKWLHESLCYPASSLFIQDRTEEIIHVVSSLGKKMLATCLGREERRAASENRGEDDRERWMCKEWDGERLVKTWPLCCLVNWIAFSIPLLRMVCVVCVCLLKYWTRAILRWMNILNPWHYYNSRKQNHTKHSFKWIVNVCVHVHVSR